MLCGGGLGIQMGGCRGGMWWGHGSRPGREGVVGEEEAMESELPSRVGRERADVGDDSSSFCEHHCLLRVS
jgi:hypothetical protein